MDTLNCLAYLTKGGDVLGLMQDTVIEICDAISLEKKISFNTEPYFGNYIRALLIRVWFGSCMVTHVARHVRNDHHEGEEDTLFRNTNRDAQELD